MDGLICSFVMNEIVDRHVDGLTIFKRREVRDKKLVVEGIGMVEVERCDIEVAYEFC